MAERRVKPFTARQEQIGHVVIRLLSAANTWVYRASGGRVGGRFKGGAPVMLLTTTGRRSGRPRTAPVLYLREGDELVVVASKGGMSHHPVWYRNLEAHAEVEVQIGGERRSMVARRASEEEKSALWPRLVEMYRDFEDYQARTKRNIPVVILSPR